MKSCYFAQYYHYGVMTGKLIEGIGDRAVFLLDGRNNLSTQKADAIEFGRKHGWIAYSINKGTFIDYRALTDIIPIS